MGENVESEIEVALHSHLESLPDVWLIAHENAEFTLPANGQYLQVLFIPGPTVTPTTDYAEFYHFGIYQVSVVVPAGTGSIAARQQVSNIVRHFDYLTEIPCLSGVLLIDKQPQPTAGLTGDTTYEVPININYHISST